MKKIMGFDSWTDGAYHYERLLPALAARSISLTLVHLGSWGNQPGCAREERRGEMLIRDISFYGRDSFENVLDIEKPDAVILLSTDTFAHRAMIRYCNSRAIPTLNLYHGLVSVQSAYPATQDSTVNWSAHARYVGARLWKLIGHTFPCYVMALLKTRGTLSDWGRFVADIFALAMGRPVRIAAQDAKTTKCAVYTNADVGHAQRFYGFNANDVVAVGNPDLSRFSVERDLLGSWSPAKQATRRTIMYIDCGLASVGQFFSGLDEFCDHLAGTARSLKAQGFEMFFKPKPHPAHVMAFFIERFAHGEIKLLRNEEFLPKLQECSACIVETTTLALVPALIGMPLLYAKYNKLARLEYGPALISYPRGHLLRNIADVSDILRADSNGFDERNLKEWIELNAGPIPPEHMPDRVASVIFSMCVREKP